MVSKHILFLDSDIIIDLLHGEIDFSELKDKFSAYYQIATTSINIYELYYGFYKLKHSKQKISAKKLELEEQNLNKIIKNLKVFEFSHLSAQKSAELFHQLISQGQRVETFDCLIAGIIITSNHSDILTGNVRHFQRFKELIVI